MLEIIALCIAIGALGISVYSWWRFEDVNTLLAGHLIYQHDTRKWLDEQEAEHGRLD